MVTSSPANATFPCGCKVCANATAAPDAEPLFSVGSAAASAEATLDRTAISDAEWRRTARSFVDELGPVRSKPPLVGYDAVIRCTVAGCRQQRPILDRADELWSCTEHGQGNMKVESTRRTRSECHVHDDVKQRS